MLGNKKQESQARQLIKKFIKKTRKEKKIKSMIFKNQLKPPSKTFKIIRYIA